MERKSTSVLIATEIQWSLTEMFRDVTEAAENICRFSSLLYLETFILVFKKNHHLVFNKKVKQKK